MIMPEDTLLSLLTGGRYQTSMDLPTIPDMAHSYVDLLIESHERDMANRGNKRIVGPGGLGLLDMIGPQKAMATAVSTGKLMNIFKKDILQKRDKMGVIKQSLDTIRNSNLPIDVKERMFREAFSSFNKVSSQSINQHKNIDALIDLMDRYDITDIK